MARTGFERQRKSTSWFTRIRVNQKVDFRCLSKPVRAMFSSQGDANTPNVMVFLTDGIPQPWPEADPCDRVSVLNEYKVKTLIIGIGSGYESSWLQCLVDLTDAVGYSISDFDDFSSLGNTTFWTLLCNPCEFFVSFFPRSPSQLNKHTIAKKRSADYRLRELSIFDSLSTQLCIKTNRMLNPPRSLSILFAFCFLFSCSLRFLRAAMLNTLFLSRKKNKHIPRPPGTPNIYVTRDAKQMKITRRISVFAKCLVVVENRKNVVLEPMIIMHAMMNVFQGLGICVAHIK